MKAYFLVVLLLSSFILAQVEFPDPIDFPGDGFWPQDAGRANPAEFFVDQEEGGVGPTFTGSFSGGLTGQFPGQIGNVFQGVDPVRGIVVVNLANNGHSSSGGGLHRGGQGGAAGNGFGITETKYPGRVELGLNEFLDPNVFQPEFHYVNSANAFVPSLFLIVLVAILF